MHRLLLLALAALATSTSSCGAEAQICGRMETLCGTKRDDCKQLVKATQESFGDEGVAGLKACFVEAQSCNEATGCAAGKGLKSLTDAMGDFLKGLVKGLEEKK